MKTAVYILLLIILPFYQTDANAATADYDIVHYDVKCEVHPKEKTFHSLTRIKIKNGDEPLSKLSLFVSDYKIHHVRMDGEELHFVVNARWMGIRFNKPVLPSQEIEMEVEFSADENSEIYLKENEFFIDPMPSKFSFPASPSTPKKDLFTFHLNVTVPEQFTVISMQKSMPVTAAFYVKVRGNRVYMKVEQGMGTGVGVPHVVVKLETAVCVERETNPYYTQTVSWTPESYVYVRTHSYEL